MQVRVLGCSGGVAKDLRTTSYLIDQDLLLDGGTGVGDLTLAEMLQIRHVLLTHAHLDHIAGLALMLASIYEKMIDPITIYAPESVLTALKQSLFNWQIWPDFTQLPTAEQSKLKLQTLAEDSKVRIKGLEVEAVLLSHTVDSYAYIINDNSSSLCFFGDTGPTIRVWQRLNKFANVAHIIVEASFPNEQAQIAHQSGHYTPALLAKDLEQLNYKPTVHIHHIKPGFEGIVIKQCHVAFAQYHVDILANNQLLELG